MGGSGGPSLVDTPLDLSDETENKLVKSMANGDTTAFDRLYNTYFPIIERTVASKFANRQDAEDVISEVFVRFWRSARSFRGDARVRTWLLTITRNAITDYYRRSGRNRWDTMAVGIVADREGAADWIGHLRDDGPEPEESVVAEEERSIVVEALHSLADQQRTILMLRFNNELSLEQIGRRLDLPVGTVKSRLHRAVRALRQAVMAQYRS